MGIQTLPCSGAEYYNYKGYFSIILLAIVDAQYNFIYIDFGSNGRASDVAIGNDSSLKEVLEKNSINFPTDYDFIGDDAFPFETYLLKPFSQYKKEIEPKGEGIQLLFVALAFGILTRRFRILQRPIEVKPEITNKIIWTVCSLHNWLRHFNLNNHYFIFY